MKNLARRSYWLAFFIFAFAVPAFANQPPGPGVALPQILMLPLMAAFTAVGGGYAILKARRQKEKLYKLRRISTWVIVTFLFVFGFTNEGASVIVTFVFALFAVQRAIRLMVWGIRSKPAPAAAPGPRTPSWRLITAGALLIVVVLFLMGSAVAFVDYWPDLHEHYQVQAARAFIASEIAYGRDQQQRTGEVRYYRIKAGEDRPWFTHYLAARNARVEFSADDKHFTVYILPSSRFPFWPYSYLTTQGSYRGDESGKIRMIRVRQRDQLCPPNAPVVMTVSEDDIAKRGQSPD